VGPGTAAPPRRKPMPKPGSLNRQYEVRGKTEWVRVTRSSPCPCCERPDWCRVSASGEVCHCMRLESDRPWPGPAGGWLHKLDGEKLDLPPPKREKPKPIRDWTAEAKRCYRHSEAVRMREFMAETLGLSVEVLERFRVGWAWQQWRQDFGCEYSTWPMRDAAGRVIGIALRARDGKKLTLPGGTPGLFYCHGWDALSDAIYLPEGASDAASLTEMGLSAAGRPSNLSVPWLPELLSPYRGREIIVLGENDKVEPGVRPGCRPDCHGCQRCWPGMHGARVVAELLSRRLHRSVTWWLTPLGTKDVRAWMAANPDAVDVELEDFDPPALVGVAGH